MGKTLTEEEVDARLLKSEHDLENAITAITGCLEYEFENEFMAEFEALNAAYIRWMGAKQRKKYFGKVS